jgi:peptidyl-prolyl cis-trans isomerase A (cyclophilin A)
MLSFSTAPNQVVVMQTTVGPMAIELLSDAPISRQNFLDYVTSGAYNNTIVHRTTYADEDGIGVVQAGGYRATDLTHIPTNAPIVNEFNAAHPNARGTLSMARTSVQDSATSEFFINTVANTALDNAPQGNAYAVFGTIIRGLGVAEAINNLGHGQTVNGLNQIPVTTAGNRVVITSAVARDEMTVNIGGSDADKSVTFKDADGTTTTISLTGAGAATVKFSGTGLTATRKGTQVIVTGASLELQRIDTTGTTAASALNIKAAGGNRGVTVGTINVAGGIGSINGAGVTVSGDVSSTAGIGKVTLGAITGGTLAIGTGSGFATATDINVQSLANSSVNSAIAITRLTTRDWAVRDGTSRSLAAPAVGTLTDPGNFEASVNVAGTVNQMTVGAVSNSRLIANVFNRATFGSLGGSLIGGLSPVGQAPGIVSLTVRGPVVSSTIVSIGNMGRVTLSGGMNGSDVVAGISTLPTAGQFPTTFGSAAGIESLTVAGRGVTFVDSRIAATTIGRLSLSRVATSLTSTAASNSKLGVKADKIGLFTAATDKNQRLSLTNLDAQAAFDQVVAAKKLNMGAFSVVLI